MKNTNLLKWFTDPRCDELFGRAFVLKAEVLARHVTGRGTLTAIARKHGVSKAAMTLHARRVRAIFGEAGKAKVDTGP